MWHHAKSPEEEAAWIAEGAQKLHEAGVAYRDMAVLYRAHYASRAVEEALMQVKVPYTLYSGVPFFGRREVKDALSYLRFVAYQDDLSFTRVANVPKRNMGQRRMAFLREWADEHECTLYEALEQTIDDEIFKRTKAKQLLELVPEELRKPELTADWEMKLGNIAKGKMKQETFLKEIRNYTCDIVDEIKTGQGTFRHDNLTNKICPNCGKKLLAVNGKNAKMLVCQDRECGYKETLSRTTNARCPKCHKRMEMYVKGKEETFICACGYKEKLSAFQARRAKEGAGVNKREVQKYMRQQQKEAKEPVNNAFAQALAGLKLE